MEEQVTYQRGALTESKIFKERVNRASLLMEGTGLDEIVERKFNT